MTKIFNLNEELEKEQERLEKEINNCSCENKTGFAQLELGRCHLCDVRFAKHEGIRFAGEKFDEFIKLLKEEFEYSKTMGGRKTNTILIHFKDLDKLAGKDLIK